MASTKSLAFDSVQSSHTIGVTRKHSELPLYSRCIKPTICFLLNEPLNIPRSQCGEYE